jgi:hypothetical protein
LKEEKAKKLTRSRSQRKKSHKQRDQDDDSESLSDGSDSEDDSSESETLSSSPSSSTGSDPSGSSSSSKDFKHRRRRSKSKEQQKASSSKVKDKKKKKKEMEKKYHKYQHDDPSTGDAQIVYGMSINGLKIDEAVAPDSMRHTDRGAMYSAAVDVTSLPGGWNSNKGVSEELFQESQKIAQLTSTILASMNRTEGMELQDTS